MKIRRYILLTICLLSGKISIAQDLEPINVGSKIPDFNIPELIKHNRKSAKMADFKGKPILIHFWNTFCADGVKEMKKIDSIQKEFGDQLLVLPVTTNTAQEATAYFSERELAKNISLPSVVNDKVFNKIFQHTVEPLQIYIDKYGTVKAASRSINLRRENIKQLVAEEEFSLPNNLNFTDKKMSAGIYPLVANNFEWDKTKIFSYKYFGAYQSNLSGRTFIEPMKNGIFRIYGINNSIDAMYATAYWRIGYTDHLFFPNATVVRNDRYSKMQSDTSGMFCYDIVTNGLSQEQVYLQLIEHLNISLKLRSKIEKKKLKCWVLKEIPGSTKQELFDKSLKVQQFMKDEVQHFINCPIDRFLKNLNSQGITAKPIISDIPKSKKLTFNLPMKYDDRVEMAKALKLFGLDLVEDEREFEVITINDDL